MITVKQFQKWARLSLVLCMFISGCRTTTPSTTPSMSVVELDNVPPPTPPSTLPELITVLSSQNAEARIGAANFLASMGSKAEVAVPALVQNLYYETNSDVRRAAVEALGAIGPNATPSVPALIVVLLADIVVQPRRQAAVALGQIGDISAIPALIHGLDDQDMGVSIQCAKAIAVLTGVQFPDLNSTGYSLDENGIPKIVVAAREWWQKEGVHRIWIPSENIPSD